MAVTNATATPAANCVVKADANGHIAIGWIADNAVTLAKLATIANSTILGNNTGLAATPVALTASQVRTMLGLATTDSPAFAGLTVTPVSSATIPLSTQSLQSTAPLGDELVTNGSFASDLTGWTGTNWSYSSGKALHATGDATALTQNITITSGSTYQVSITVSGLTAGTVSVAVGGVYIYNYGSTTGLTNATWSRTLVAATTGSVELAITPTSTFDGSVDSISVKLISGTSQVAQVWKDDAGSVFAELRGKLSLANQFIGAGAGRHNTTGSNNAAVGPYALYGNTTGFNNAAVGPYALYGNTTGSNNAAVGLYALYGNTTGSNNAAVGLYALYGNTTGFNNAAVGLFAGRYITGGGANQTPANSVFFGYDTRAYADGDTNEIVIGASAIGAGSNSVTLGNTSIVTTILRGNVGIGATSFGTSAAKVCAIATGTAPSSSPADMVQIYSADFGGSAGRATLHVRTEDGHTIALARQSHIADPTTDTTSLQTAIKAVLTALETIGLLATS